MNFSHTKVRHPGRIASMKDGHDTNLGWWVDKPDREPRPSSFAPISGPFRRRRAERAWFKAALIVALMVGFGWSLLNLTRLAG